VRREKVLEAGSKAKFAGMLIEQIKNKDLI
jgi:hypothetical protein